MSEKRWWDSQTKVIRSQVPAKMTPQQRANWVFCNPFLTLSISGGYSDGLKKGKMWLDFSRPVL